MTNRLSQQDPKLIFKAAEVSLSADRSRMLIGNRQLSEGKRVNR
jgi:hypothetical protein